MEFPLTIKISRSLFICPISLFNRAGKIIYYLKLKPHFPKPGELIIYSDKDRKAILYNVIFSDEKYNISRPSGEQICSIKRNETISSRLIGGGVNHDILQGNSTIYQIRVADRKNRGRSVIMLFVPLIAALLVLYANGSLYLAGLLFIILFMAQIFFSEYIVHNVDVITRGKDTNQVVAKIKKIPSMSGGQYLIEKVGSELNSTENEKIALGTLVMFQEIQIKNAAT